MNISYSRISTYSQCPLKYKYQYIDKLDISAPALRIGSTCHKIIANQLAKPKLDNKLDYIDIIDIVEDNNTSDSELKEVLNIVTEDKIKLIIDTLSLRYTSYEVEKRYEYYDEENKVNLVGVIDLLLYNKSRKEYTILDFKTSKINKKGTHYPPDWLQLRMYYHILTKNKMNIDKNLCVFFLRSGLRVYDQITNRKFAYMKRKVYKIAKEIREDTQFKPKLNKFCYYCPYKDKCLIPIAKKISLP